MQPPADCQGNADDYEGNAFDYQKALRMGGLLELMGLFWVFASVCASTSRCYAGPIQIFRSTSAKSPPVDPSKFSPEFNLGLEGLAQL